MDDVRLGSTLRAIRIRKHLRQSDVARRARVSRQLVGRVEAGDAGSYPLRTIRDLAAALGARFEGRLLYRGAELGRILNAAHVDLHRSVAAFLASLEGWEWLPEVTFSEFGERGVIDILAWHRATRSLLIIELKTELVDPQELAATMHRRVRLGTAIGRRHGWVADSVSAWVIVRRSRTEQRRLRHSRAILRRVFPHDGRQARRWIRDPKDTLSALSMWTDVTSGGLRRTIGATERVRARSIAPGQA